MYTYSGFVRECLSSSLDASSKTTDSMLNYEIASHLQINLDVSVLIEMSKFSLGEDTDAKLRADRTRPAVCTRAICFRLSSGYIVVCVACKIIQPNNDKVQTSVLNIGNKHKKCT